MAETGISLDIRKIQVIINPASGKNEPILNTLNDVFHPAGVAWDVSITYGAGDATLHAREAAAAGVDVVAAYGGDGTVLEVASGLVGSHVPLAILPGGTANMLAAELGIPDALRAAAELILSPDKTLRAVDMGQVGDDFFFHLGMGVEGTRIERADREAKDSSGMLAYLTSLLQSVREREPVCYTLTLDGQREQVEGINCMITTFGSLGVGGLKLSKQIDPSDGLLDVIVIRQVDLRQLAEAAASVVAEGDLSGPLLHWQVREVRIEADPPPETVTRDGEVYEVAEIAAHVVPGAIHVLVPVAS